MMSLNFLHQWSPLSGLVSAHQSPEGALRSSCAQATADPFRSLPGAGNCLESSAEFPPLRLRTKVLSWKGFGRPDHQTHDSILKR